MIVVVITYPGHNFNQSMIVEKALDNYIASLCVA